MIVGAVVGGQRNDWISHCFSCLSCRLPIHWRTENNTQ
jgi:hypothetical protein